MKSPEATMIAAPTSMCVLRHVAEEDVAEDDRAHDQRVLVRHDDRSRREPQRLVDAADGADRDRAEDEKQQDSRLPRSTGVPVERRAEAPKAGAPSTCGSQHDVRRRLDLPRHDIKTA